jgi:DNA-directed RNA polymerase II subunit RPB1
MSINSKYYGENIKNIKEIKFGIYTNDMVLRYSAVKDDPFGINVPDSYDNYEPKKGGLVDLRLGTCDPYLNCTTCGLNSLECNGHFGHTVLAEPVFHYGFLPHLTTILKCICHKCSNILVERSDENMKRFQNKSGKNRFKEIKELTKNINFCTHCGTPVPKIKKEIKETTLAIRIILEKEVGNIIVDEATGISTEGTKIIRDYLTPRQCYYLLRNISDIDANMVGFDVADSRPEDMIITKFPIPPVIIRPTAKIDFLASSTMEDSLTLKIADIITWNIRARADLNKEVKSNNDTKTNNDSYTLVQYNIATYFDNDTSSLPRSEFKTGNRPTSSISDRIKGKEGRIRMNLMGKRVDFSARSVITSDPNIDIDEVGVPLKIAKDLTIPEEVTPQNIKQLMLLVQNGRDIYPGANYVFRSTNLNGKTISQRIDLRYRKANIKLSYGDVVERHVVNGDYVLFNRQPTLHKPSMMGHKVHVLNREDANTFRMNVSVTGPYNADFDGDEMNIFLAQSIQARNELERIANVKYQIIGGKDSNPIIGCKLDAIAGAYLLSIDPVIPYDIAANLLCTTSSTNKNKLIKGKDITGKELFSYIIPSGINSVKEGKNFQIKNGNLIEGVLDKSQLATKKNSIIHYIWDKYGPTRTQKFIDDTQRLVISYLYNKGLTVGFNDCLIADDMIKQINEIIHTKVLSSNHMITQFENDKDKINSDIGEEIITLEINSISANISKIIFEVLDKSNAFNIMISLSGSKGSTINLGQIAGCVGQVTLNEQRIKKKVSGRTLAIFHQNDDTPKARGFITSNFLDGLKGHEFFFHVMSGREGLIDTAIKTAESGYIQRKLIKSLEDMYVNYEGMIRTANGVLVQYLYGDSGINQQRQTELKIHLINCNDKMIQETYVFSDSDMKKIKIKTKYDNKKMFHMMKKMRDNLRSIYFKSTSNYKVITDNFMLPVNLRRITQEYMNNIPSPLYNEIDPQYIIDSIENILNNYDNRLVTIMNDKSVLLKQDDIAFKTFFSISLYDYIGPKKCIIDYKLTKKMFDDMINDIKLAFSQSMVEPGEMVGIIAAQSIGEPTSQMTLNTKHFAGVTGKGSASMGVPRIKELLSYSKSIKTPQMTVYFDKKYNTNKSDTNIISSYLKHLTIGELIDSAEILYTTDGNDSMSQMIHNDKVNNPFYINNDNTKIENMPFIIRLKLNLEKMMDKETTLLDIKTKFITYWYKNFSNLKNVKKGLKDILIHIDKLAILSNNDNIIHIRFKINDIHYSLLTSFMTIILDTITLKGINNISNINMVNERQITFNESGDPNVNKEYVITTNGINIEGLLYIKGIDHTRTKTNDIATVYKMYGIEAARKIIIDELLTTFNSDGSDSLNHAHVSLLVDLMTYSGEVISIDRHGLNKVDNDPLSRASFEKTMEHFINAAIFSEADKLKSVSARVAIGRVIPGGTGAFDIILDTDMLKNSEYIENETGGRSNFILLNKDPLFNDIIKRTIGDRNFFIPK